MMNDLHERIERAKEILAIARHGAMATVNEDGSPHNTPLRILHDQNLEHLYWGSHPESQHSINLQRTGKAFFVFYDIREKGGLYISSYRVRVAVSHELDTGVDLVNSIRKTEGKQALTKDYFEVPSPQRLWVATVDKIWTNTSERNNEGLVLKDIRVEIRRGDLIPLV